MKWLEDYRQDIQRYVVYAGSETTGMHVLSQGLWALLQYRISHAIYESRVPRWAKKPILRVLLLWQKAIEILTGISLPFTASIGPGLHLGHYGNIIVNSHAVIGRDCSLAQGVTIGESGRGAVHGVPVIGDRVWIGTNSVVAGKVAVGDDVVVGAVSLVNRDVPPHTTVVGVPAQVVSDRGSEQYVRLAVEP